MKNLFLIDGASGTGKTDLIEYVSDYKTDVSYIKKYTTRKIREYEKLHKEKLDLIHIEKEEFSKRDFDYKYTYGGKQYGFYKKEIINAFKQYNDVFIIIRNNDLIEKLQQDFKFINVVSIFIYTDRDQIIDRLKKDKHNKEDIEFRIKRLGIAYRSYLNNPTLYDEILINSGSEVDYKRIVDSTLKKYRFTPQIDPNLIFVIMSFDEKYNHIFEEFKDAAKIVDPSLEVHRIDKKRGDYQITDEILQNIAKARLLICDLTDERPNVYYELGYARGLKKKVINCAKKGTKLHFDIQGFRTIFYSSSSHLRKEIIEEIREHFKV